MCELSGPPQLKLHFLWSEKGTAQSREEGGRVEARQASVSLPHRHMLLRTQVGREGQSPSDLVPNERRLRAHPLWTARKLKATTQRGRGALDASLLAVPSPFWVWSRSLQPLPF